MIKKILLLLIIASTWACSTYNVAGITEKSGSIKSIKSSAIIIRATKNSRIAPVIIEKNLTVCLNGYKHLKKLKVATPNDNSIQVSKSLNDSFYQVSDSGKFLKFKSIGVVRLFVANNSDKLKSIMQENKTDSLVLYEVDSGLSAAMQYVEFNSVMVIIDKKLNIVYLDHQKDAFDSIENEAQILKSSLTDRISDRLLEILKGYDFIESIK